MAVGHVGDYLLANDKIRAVIGAPGREMSFMLTYGGNIIDADVVRPDGDPGRDNFGAMTPLINISSTVNVQEITVVNDGSNGEPAILRTLGVDDLLDAIDTINAVKGFGLGSIPPSAQDRDLPIEVMSEYTLGLGDTAIRIETTIKNNGSEPLQLYVGDFVNGSGEVDTFAPPLGFGDVVLRPDLPFLAFAGVGGASGLSYGILPQQLPGSPLVASAFGQSGIEVYLLGQAVLGVLVGQAPGIFPIAPGETNSFVRYFTVRNGDVDAVVAENDALLGKATGTIRGRVTAGGAPAAGATVSLVRTPGANGAPFDVLDAFRTDVDGRYEGAVQPGDYRVLARLEGYPYDSGGAQPEQHAVTISQGGDTVQDIALPATGQLRVTAVDEAGKAIPAKVSVVGFDPAPDLVNAGGAFVFHSPIEQKGAELFGLTDVRFLDQSGDSGAFAIPPSDYEVVVTRGPEYSAYRQRVTVEADQITTVDAVLARVVDTTGFVSTDYHVHLINSPDSNVPRDDRIRTMAAEGVNYFVASDHDFLTDLRPDIERLGLQDFVAATISSEITTFDLGHFNAWPLQRLPDTHTGGSIDWGRAGVPPGQDFPSLGSYDLSPAELFAAARGRIVPGVDGVVQVNHINSGTLGYLHLAGIDTALDPPQSFTPPGLIRQDPAITNLYDENFDSLELWIEGSRAQTQLLQDANLGDWFNLLNQGRIKTATSDSDSHTTAIIQAGGPRNYVASPSDVPSELDDATLAQSVRDGRVVGTNAPFVRVTIEGDGGATAGLALGESRLVAATSGSATLRIDVESPEWAEFDTVEVFTNTVPTAVPDENFNGAMVPSYAVAPDITLHAGTDFTVDHEVVDDNIPGATRLRAAIEVPLSVSRDTWVVALVKGTDGVSPPLWPMNPQDLDQASNQTLDDLTDGNLGEGGNPALAYTNALFIDFDGNGQFDASGEEP